MRNRVVEDAFREVLHLAAISVEPDPVARFERIVNADPERAALALLHAVTVVLEK